MKLLVKEIRSKTGELHFRRWRFLETPWLSIYLHYLAKSDEDEHPHDHPWSFISLILRGGYREESCRVGQKPRSVDYRPGDIVRHSTSDFHKIKLFAPTWTLVICGKRRPDWGYLVNDKWVDNQNYRQQKRQGKFLKKKLTCNQIIIRKIWQNFCNKNVAISNNSCRYCKINFDDYPEFKDKGCLNCWRYAHQEIENDLSEELELFNRYWCVPYNWQSYDSWRDDPYYFKENNPYK